jgi:diguanylate cyclase (GGDEF)-like protein
MNQAPCSLLLVDDEPYILGALSGLLNPHFDVLTAESAAAAREIFGRRTVDLILADQRMPGGNGVELLEWVSQQSPQTVRLMMTGYTDFEQTVQAINRGQVYRIILKPWRTDELLLILHNAARAFLLARSHEELLQDLRRLNADLDQRVHQRTHELEDAIRQLQQRNSMLEKMSMTDPLTGLPNRRAVDRVAEAELRRRVRHPSSLALGLIDADRFKEINDRHLLPGGDQVLIGLAKTLAAALRVEDTVGRIGGEEFLVLAPQTGQDGAEALAERLRSAAEASQVCYRGEVIRVTISAGFAVADSGVPASCARMKDLAAIALAEAKASGRNRCIVHQFPNSSRS